jgi:8-hydroxy-5-deazaflavin:NADPH oxidoreductase
MRQTLATWLSGSEEEHDVTKVGVLGSAVVGQTLAGGFKKHGYDVRIGSRSPQKLADFSARSGIQAGTSREVAAWAEVVVLAVKGTAAEEAVREADAANLNGKLVIDTTNPIANEPPEDGVLKFFTSPNDSLMERLQKTFPEAKFVKAFNSVGSALMVNPQFPHGRPTMFYCGNDADAKNVVAKIVDQFGWDGADMGTARAARAIEPLCQLWCIRGLRENAWTNHAFALLRR